VGQKGEIQPLFSSFNSSQIFFQKKITPFRHSLFPHPSAINNKNSHSLIIAISARVNNDINALKKVKIGMYTKLYL